MKDRSCEKCGQAIPWSKTDKERPSRYAKKRFCSRRCSAMRDRKGGIKARFWEKVNRGSPGECWEWVGATTHHGHGSIWDNRAGGQVGAHRISYEIHFGPQGDLHVLHRCDNPPCVNPSHLYLGDHAQNMRDMHSRGRRSAARGSRHGKAKLDETKVRKIKKLAELGWHPKRIADRYRVTRQAIDAILSGRTWKHVEIK